MEEKQVAYYGRSFHNMTRKDLHDTYRLKPKDVETITKEPTEELAEVVEIHKISESKKKNPTIKKQEVQQMVSTKSYGKTSIFDKISEEGIIEFFKSVAFMVLPFLLVWVSVSFFTTSANTWWDKLTIGLLNAIPEITALWVLFFVAGLFKKKFNILLKIAAVSILLIVYLFLNLQSYVARVGYVISEVQKNAVLIEAKNSNFDQATIKVKSIDLQISDLYAKWANAKKIFTNENDVIWYRSRVSSEIASLTDKRDKYNVQKGVQKVDTVMSSYVAIAKLLFNMDPLILFTFTTSIRMFSLDICAIVIIFLSQRKPKPQSEETVKTIASSIEVKEKSLLEKYIEALYINEGRLRSLPPDYKVSEVTKIPLEVCSKFRKALKTEIVIGALPALGTSGTYTISNCSKKDLLEYVNRNS